MIKVFFFITLLPFAALSQTAITGRVLNRTDTRPVANASVFLSNATIGNTTANDGTFILHNIKPGKYDLVISIIGFETYTQTVIVDNTDIKLPDITIFPKTITLNEVRIRPHNEPNREKYYNWFKDEFLGPSALAKECKILNPYILDLDYDDDTGTLTVSSTGFLEIENDALGYKIKYLLSDFTLNNKDEANKKIYYKGAVLFEEMKGTPTQERRWQKTRQETYEGSVMHFLRSAISNSIAEEGFRVVQLAIYANPERPSDSLIDAKIKFYKELKTGTGNRRDSLSFWIKKSKLQKTFQKLFHYPLKGGEFVKTTDQRGLFALGCNTDALYVTYNKNHRFNENEQLGYLNDPRNDESSLINFNEPYAFFYSNGVITNPYSVLFNGKWAKNRLAELLPVDYEITPNINAAIDSTVIKNLTAKLNLFSTEHIVEKAYLHFDKPYYAAGDTMYFKAYLTQGETHEPSTLSGVLHVDLINTNNEIAQSLKLQVVGGVAWGDFALPDSLPKGNYRVRAYTQWMRNDDVDRFFDQTIPVGSALNNNISEGGALRKSIINAKADIQFFPEGGSLITGVRSKVAFKAIGTRGLGVNVNGVVIDNNNRTICSFASVHLGMGYFYFNPEAGENYKVKVNYPNGMQDIVDMPKQDARGIVLSVNNDSLPKASVRIEADKATYQQNKGKNYTFIIYSGGIVTTVTCKLDSQVVTLNILKRHFRSGVCRLTLFSPTGEPLNERVMFIQNYDQLYLDINSKRRYAKREKGNIKLDVKDRAENPSAGHFSVSVTDENKIAVDENSENTILTNILLTSELKGYVEQPNYYFIDTSANARVSLDVLMLTQGYRRFKWKQLLNNTYPSVTYQPEKGLEIAGIAKTLGGKPIANGTVSLISPIGGPLLSQQTDDKGNFRFSNLVFMDTTHFILSAANAKGKNNTQLIYSGEQPNPITDKALFIAQEKVNSAMTGYLENEKKQQEQELKYRAPKGIMLKEVKIKEKKRDDDYRTVNLNGPGHADQIVHRSEFRGGGFFSDQFNGVLRGVTFQGTPGSRVAFLTTNLGMVIGGNAASPMVLVVDGVVLNQGGVMDIASTTST